MRHPAIRLRIFLCALLGAALLASGSGLAAQQSGERRHRLGASARDGRRPRDPEARRQRVRRRGGGRRRAGGGGAVLVRAGRRRVLAAAPRARRIPGDGGCARDGAAAARRRRLFSTPRASPCNAAITAGGKAAGIPGTPAALAHVAQRYGRLPLAASARARRSARARGFRRGSALRAHRGDARAPAAGRSVDTRASFSIERPCAGGGLRAAPAGAGGDAGAGSRGRALPVSTAGRWRARWSRRSIAAGGVWQLADLADYRVVERAPVRFRVSRRDDHRCGAAFGGRHRARAGARTCSSGSRSADARAPDAAHLVVEALRRAFHDRARYPRRSRFRRACRWTRLVSKDYARRRAREHRSGARHAQRRAGRGARRARAKASTPRICR